MFSTSEFKIVLIFSWIFVLILVISFSEFCFILSIFSLIFSVVIVSSILKFLYALRQAEGGTANNNPFNTTWRLENSTNYGTNSAKVQEYQTPQDGLKATCKTLKLGYYTCIVDGLIDDIGAERISTECNSALKTWGTHGSNPLITKILQSDNINPPPIG